MYNYKAKVIDVYDGDSITLEIDLGFHVKIVEKARVNGIDTPELRSHSTLEKDLAKTVRKYVRDLILDKEVEIISHKEGKYGRYLVDVGIDGKDLATELLRKGYAKPYDGGKKEPWFL
jgi:micrococcal nuclease